MPKNIRSNISDQPPTTDGAKVQPASETRENTNCSLRRPPTQSVGTHLEIVEEDNVLMEMNHRLEISLKLTVITTIDGTCL